MSLSILDKIFLAGIYFGIPFTMGGYAGAVGLSDKFSVVTYAGYGLFASMGAGIGVTVFSPEDEPLPSKPEPDDIYERHYLQQNPPVMSSEEQNAGCKTFLQREGAKITGFVVGTLCGMFVYHGSANIYHHYKPAAQIEESAPEGVKDIFKEKWNSHFKPKDQAPAP